MLFLLILSFHSGFEWIQFERTDAKEISEVIKESKVVKRYGAENLEKRFVRLNSGIFEGGCKIILSKGTEIRRIPEDLKIYKRAIKMKKYDRYSALYEKGELKREWEKLEKESAEKLGVSSLSFEELERFLPERNCEECEEGRVNSGAMDEKMPNIEYPSKTYYSFIEIEEDRTIKCIPVVLTLCPLAQKIEEYMNSLRGG